MTKELDAPVMSTLPTTMAQMSTMMQQLLYQSANFTKFTESTLGTATYTPALMSTFKPIGTHTAHICEATDAAWSSSAVVADGMSGDTNYLFGSIKVLATVGEYHPATGCALCLEVEQRAQDVR